MDHTNKHSNDHEQKTHHVILSDATIWKVGIGLFILTGLTVAIAQVNLGWMNFPVAMLVALVKGSLVALIFMGLKWDKVENAVILLGSLLFLAIFIVLTMSDLLFRPPGSYTHGKTFAVVAGSGPAKFKKPWLAQDAVRKHGQELFAQCAACHGDKGHGDGAAAASLTVKPRNFTQGEGWKRGRKVSDVFQTLTKPDGLVGMPAFGSLPAEDRWALAQYVLSFGPAPAEASNDDLKKAGVVDPSKDDGGMGGGSRSLPIEFTIERMAEDGATK